MIRFEKYNGINNFDIDLYTYKNRRKEPETEIKFDPELKIKTSNDEDDILNTPIRDNEENPFEGKPEDLSILSSLMLAELPKPGELEGYQKFKANQEKKANERAKLCETVDTALSWIGTIHRKMLTVKESMKIGISMDITDEVRQKYNLHNNPPFSEGKFFEEQMTSLNKVLELHGWTIDITSTDKGRDAYKIYFRKNDSPFSGTLKAEIEDIIKSEFKDRSSDVAYLKNFTEKGGRLDQLNYEFEIQKREYTALWAQYISEGMSSPQDFMHAKGKIDVTKLIARLLEEDKYKINSEEKYMNMHCKLITELMEPFGWRVDLGADIIDQGFFRSDKIARNLIFKEFHSYKSNPGKFESTMEVDKELAKLIPYPSKVKHDFYQLEKVSKKECVEDMLVAIKEGVRHASSDMSIVLNVSDEFHRHYKAREFKGESMERFADTVELILNSLLKDKKWKVDIEPGDREGCDVILTMRSAR